MDSVVSSELPDPMANPELFALVNTHMIHGPCMHGHCLNQENVCTKGFSKPFQNETDISSDSYVKTRQCDDGECIWFPQQIITNQYVVAYSPYLLCKYEAHINV